MTQWIEPPDVDIPADMQQTVGGHPLVAGLLARRGYRTPQTARAFLDPDHYLPSPGAALQDLNQAADLLAQAIQDRRRLCVWGDFDVDGQTATTLLVSTLQDLGAEVRFHIPVRARESHGVNLPVLEKLVAGGLDLLLTCDTGIAAHQAVAFARQQGVQVVITDHHDLPPSLPEAEAVVNPKRLPPGHPLAGLPGVGVAYKLAEALYARAGRPDEVAKHLDLVALGIVADIALQTADTRYLLQRGLAALRRTDRLGLQALMDLADLNPDWLTEDHIGFVLGPRLNALGRLADANLAVEFLTTADLGRARIIAQQLEGLNAERKLLTDQVFQGALAQIERDPALLDHAALVLAHPTWPGGVIGIVASRLVERFHKPTILFSAPPDGPARGSARSIEGCNITAAIAAQAESLYTFGGHPMAAGLSLDPARIDEFRLGLSRTVAGMLGDLPPEPPLPIDGYLPFSDLSWDLVEDLERLAPFGPGNPPLTFACRDLHLKSHSALGRGGEHLQVIVEDDQEYAQRVFWWQGAGWPLPTGRFDLAYSVRASSYRGQRELQVQWVGARLREEPQVLVRETRAARQAIDQRRALDPGTALQAIQAREPDLQVWAEGQDDRQAAFLTRGALAPGAALAVWTIPPGPQELQAALEIVDPGRVYLFAEDPGLDQLGPFLKRLAGLVKHALAKKHGQTTLSELAAASAQPASTIRLGLAWLAAKGMIRFEVPAEGTVLITKGEGEARPGLQEIETALQAAMAETAAYRRYYTGAEAEKLVNPVEQGHNSWRPYSTGSRSL